VANNEVLKVDVELASEKMALLAAESGARTAADTLERVVGAELAERGEAQELDGAETAGLHKGENPQLLKGVVIEDLDQDKRRQLRIPSNLKGVLVAKVSADSKAAKAGLEVGDIIMMVDNKAVSSVAEAFVISRSSQAEVILLWVLSKGRKQFIPVQRKG